MVVIVKHFFRTDCFDSYMLFYVFFVLFTLILC